MNTDHTSAFNRHVILLLVVTAFFSCTIPRKYQKNKPFVFDNKIELSGLGTLSPNERNDIRQRLGSQLDDSLRVTTRDFLFLIHVLKRPAVFDTQYAAQSARNMQNSLIHLGYHRARVRWEADTSFQNNGTRQPVTTRFQVFPGEPVRIDSFRYSLSNPDLQQLALTSAKLSPLRKGNPVTKTDVQGEIGRLVDLFRNNGYYKFTTEDLRMQGDTAMPILTDVSDDPFESLAFLAEANQRSSKPTIRLNLVQNTATDSNRLIKYSIRQVIVYPDFRPEDPTRVDTVTLKEENVDGIIYRYRRYRFGFGFLRKQLTLLPGNVYRQQDFSQTLGNFDRTGLWQNVSAELKEVSDSTGWIDVHIQLYPVKKFGFEANVEASYSANSAINNASVANAGNLLGFSANVSLQNRNIGKEGIKMTHALRAGIELNLASQAVGNRRVNANEFSYINTISFPRLIGLGKWINRNQKPISQQTFINVTPTFTRRIDLYNLLSAGLALGNEWSVRGNRKHVLKVPNIEYSYLYNESDSFKTTLNNNPFLRYSFNTALVMGSSYSYSSSYTNPKHPNRQRKFKWNMEESGLLWGRLGIFKRDLRQFIKTDVEYNYTTRRNNTEIAIRLFGGVGVPLDNNDTASLPFFKQYFAGGPNSMRGWPIRGIGRGAQPLAPYESRQLNDRTGDIRFEANFEYRYPIATIIPNSLSLRGAIFVDAGNIWNFNNTRVGGGYDSLQFSFRNFYKQLGVSAGTGFRFDFNYIILRLDLGFRFKRPELSENNGWKAPSIGLDDMWKKLFTRGPDDIYRRWRYENFNFTIGLNYPF